jgi:hypothetical protein
METNFHQKHEHEHEQETTSTAKTGIDFATGDEMLRHDRDQNPPPPEIAERLNESLANEPKRNTSFWTKLGFRK